MVEISAKSVIHNVDKARRGNSLFPQYSTADFGWALEPIIFTGALAAAAFL